MTKKVYNLEGGGKVTYIPGFLKSDEATKLLNHLKIKVDWTHGVYKMYGKEINTPRLLYAMRDKNEDITKSYNVTGSMEWTSSMKEVRKKVEKVTKYKFKYAQLNYYRTGDDYIGYHTDKEVAPSDIIASISLGAKRRFTFRNIEDTTKKITIELEHGSLLIMDEDAAKNKWKHALPKMKNVKERINITFRPK